MIKKTFNQLKENDLIKDNLILFLGTMSAAILTFLFHFYMGRSLGPEAYGVLGVTITIVYLMNIFLNTLQTTIAKFVSKFKTQKDLGKVHYLVKHLLIILSLVALVAFIVLNWFVPKIANFLNLPTLPIRLVSLILFTALLLPIVRGTLQGLQFFKTLGLNVFFEGFSKLLIGIILVEIGFSVNGAIVAVVLSYIVPFLLGLIPLKKLFKIKVKTFPLKNIYMSSIPLLLMVFFLTSYYSIDLILVKHFLSSLEAGYYSAIGMIGKILFFASISISQVLVPKVIESKTKNNSSKQILIKSIAIVLAILIPGILVFFIFPELIVKILYGSQFLEITKYIGPFGIFMVLFSLIYLLCFYKISLNHKKFIFLLFLGLIAEIGLISIFHANLWQIIYIQIGISSILFITLLTHTLLYKNE